MTTPVSPAVLMGQHGYDPRGSSLDGRGEDVQRMDNDIIDSRINRMPLEVYFHYAKLEREREETAPGPEGSFYTRMFKKATGTNRHEHVISDANESTVEKEKEKHSSSAVVVTESERHHAYRALRTASWQGVFFLITTDILGPSSAPQALNYLGYGGGVLVYFFFYVMAFFAGQSLWREYMEMDSALYPVKCFADLGERLLGRTFRHICNITQSLQLVLNVAILLEGNAITLATLIDYKLCYVVITLLWMLSGMIGGQIKSLRNFAVFANLNIFLNVVVIVMTIAGCSVYAPIPTLNFPTLTAPYPPVMHTAFADASYGWYRQVSGVQYAVFAYGGAMIFVEFMAEMRRPRDFWKAAFYAQTFIFIVYLIYGVVIYYFQGQYTYIIPSLNVTNAKFQLAVNIIGLFTTMVAAVLYGNIGVKIFYFNILQAYFKFPELTTRGGRIAWTFTVIGYWALAFILASAIPNLGSLIVLVGALCILQFTYTFPPLMWCAYMIKKHAMEADRPWSPGMELYSNRIDSWKDASRWKRGIAKQWYIKAFLILLFLGALALSGLGCYAGIEGIIETFQAAGTATSFGCRAPGQPA